MLPFLDGFRDITFVNVLIRMLVAVFCSAVIGLERSVKNRSAGFRTHILVCVGAATASLTGHYLYLVAQLPTDMTRRQGPYHCSGPVGHRRHWSCRRFRLL